MGSWCVVLPGEPPSVNTSYKPAIKDGFRKDGTPYQYHSIVKRERVTQWQIDMLNIIRAARPSSWRPAGQVVVEIRYWFGKDRDADNPLKAILDTLQTATGVNDIQYLPRVMSKTTGVSPAQRRTELTIYEASE